MLVSASVNDFEVYALTRRCPLYCLYPMHCVVSTQLTSCRRPCHSSARQNCCQDCLAKDGLQPAVDAQPLGSVHTQPPFAVQQTGRRWYSAVPHPESHPADDNFERLWQSRRSTGGRSGLLKCMCMSVLVMTAGWL